MKLRWRAESVASFILFAALANNLYKPAVTVATIVAVGVIVWRYRSCGSLLLPVSPECKLIYLSMLTFAGALLFSGFFSQTPVLSIKRGLEYFYWAIPFLLVCMLCKDDEDLTASWLGVTVAILFMTCYGVYKRPEVLKSIARLGSFYHYPNMLGAILILLLPFPFLGIKRYWNRSKGLLIIAVLASSVGLWALFATQSRGAFMGLVAGVFIWALCQIKNKRLNIRKAFVAIILMAIIAMFLSPVMLKRASDTGAIQGDRERMMMWQSAIHMWKDYPFFGVGLGNFNCNYRDGYVLPEAKEPDVATPHNTLLNYLTEAGVLGGIGYFGLLGGQLTFFIRYMKRQPSNLFLQAMLIAWVAIHVHGMVDVLLVIQPINRLYWALFALACSSVLIERQGNTLPN